MDLIPPSGVRGLFIIRIYAILINNKNEILLTDEMYQGKHFTKFPGGGLEFGEGTHGCLKREFREEFKVEIEILSHFYTTDFFQESAFDKSKQVISIYYKVKLSDESNTLQSFDSNVILKWKNFETLTTDDVTFPIDKKVVGLLKSVN